MTDDEKRNEALRWAVTAGTRGEAPEETVKRAEAYYQYLISAANAKVVTFPRPIVER